MTAGFDGPCGTTADGGDTDTGGGTIDPAP